MPMMNERTTEMQVYIVMGFTNYEGCDGDSVRVFSTLEVAEEYARIISDEMGFDSAFITQCEVE